MSITVANTLVTFESVQDEVLSRQGCAAGYTNEPCLLSDMIGIGPMATDARIASLKDRSGVLVSTNSLDADAFVHIGSLTNFVQNDFVAA